MKILITGASVEKNGDMYEVIYNGNNQSNNVVFQSKLKDICILTALDKTKLDQLAGTNVVKFRAS